MLNLKNIKIKWKRTIPILKRMGIVFCLVLFLPYIITVFGRGIEKGEEWIRLGGPELFVVTEKGRESIPVDEYLLKIMAPFYQESYSVEQLEVLSIVLRTNLIVSLQDGSSITDESWNQEERYLAWGNQYENYEKNLRTIISNTQGIILLYQGDIALIDEKKALDNLQSLTYSNFCQNTDSYINSTSNSANMAYLSILNEFFEDYVIYHYF